MGGSGLLFGLMLVILIGGVALVLAFMVIPALRRETERRRSLVDSGPDSLVYEVPEGQDPVAIVAALRSDGLEAVEVMRQGRQRIVISGAVGREALRPRARSVIANGATLNLEGDRARQQEVRFVDE